ncbi:ATP-binding cassette domain-containing protein [Rhodobacterales bacterium HKCCE3408]|nr:ATP-binding cassette domain-containing protein [Rhodobacterales bacterium HKCCE3408]
MSLLSVQTLTVMRGECPVVDHVSFDVGPGECVGLIGPNGAGKTTLFRALLGFLDATGRCDLRDRDARARAHHAAWLPQAREIAWPIPVETLVTLGRIPHLAAGARPGPADRDAIAAALERMELTDFARRPATELSGGEQARVLIARALAQDTPLILADEPVAGLDPAHQISAMAEFARIAADGRAVVVSLHDLGLAARYCTRLILMHRGRIEADGPPRDVLTPDNLARVFGVSAYMLETEAGLVFQPMGVVP